MAHSKSLYKATLLWLLELEREYTGISSRSGGEAVVRFDKFGNRRLKTVYVSNALSADGVPLLPTPTRQRSTAL